MTIAEKTLPNHVRTAIVRIINDLLTESDRNGKPDRVYCCQRIEGLIDALMIEPDAMQLTGSEALYAFAGWLTTRDEPTTFSAKHEAAVIAERVKQYCDTQGLAEPRSAWEKLVVPVKESEFDQ